jgi:hypothetical protein
MKQYFVLLMICAISFAQCVTPKGGQETALPKNTPAPEWVLQRPISNGYYIGVSSCSKKLNPVDYAAIAKKNALSDMASSVSVRVQGQSFLNTMEVNKVFSEDFTSSINTTTDIVFEDYETAGIYENATEYWIYLRISKSAYQTQQERKKNDALNLAYQHYENSVASKKRNQISSAIDQLFHALFTIKPYWNESNPYTTPSGENLLLDQQIYADIQAIMASLKLTSDDAAVILNSKNNYSQSLEIEALHNGSPAIGIPILYHFPTDKYTRAKKVLIGTNGKVVISVSDVPMNSKLPQLEIKLDTESLIPSDLDDKICRKILQSTPVNELNIPIHLIKPTFFIKSTEKEFDQNNQQQLLAIAVQSYLTQQGYQTTSSNKADYTIEIEANTKAAGQANDFSSALLEMKLTLKDNQENNIRYQNDTNSIKGVQLSIPAAGVEAYKKGKIKLEDEWLNLMLQAIL